MKHETRKDRRQTVTSDRISKREALQRANRLSKREARNEIARYAR